MNIIILQIIGVPMVLLLIYWYSRKNEAFGDGIALLCLLFSRPFIVMQDKLKGHLSEPTNVVEDKSGQDDATKSEKNETMHRKVNEIVGDEIGAGIGSIIVAADTYLAVVFNSSLFKTHEVTLSSSIFEWASGLLWIAVPAMFGIVVGECAGIVKSSGIFPKLHPAARWIIGIISFLLMCLSMFLVMYAYAFRGVKVFDPTNTFLVAQMGESILTLLGLLVGAASVPALMAVINGISTLFVMISFALYVACQLITSVLDAYCLFVTGGETSVYMFVDKPLRVVVEEFRFPLRRSKRLLQAALKDEERDRLLNSQQTNNVTHVAEEKPQNQPIQALDGSPVLQVRKQIAEPVFVEFSGNAAQNGNDLNADHDKKKQINQKV